ncbi:MAG TPA: hypothetical protein DCS67_00525 [Clostridiales bacterium UBA8960]|nr:hypothetical protein [Clostridiales bacterium UBA8960]
MYIDSRKFKYESPVSDENRQAIARDKKFTEEAYIKWFNSNISNIVERLWEIDDIGVVEQVGEFVKLLKEAEFTYSIGAYKSAIALVGICAEDLCRFFSTASGHNLFDLTQNDRIDRLHQLSLFSDSVRNDFHIVRRLRNDCLHFNAGFKSKSDRDLKSDALVAVNTLKSIYARIIGVTSYDSLDSSKLIAILDVVLQEAIRGNHDGVANTDDAIIRARNILAEATGVDISINLGNSPIIAWSEYSVDEIDLDTLPPEITLSDTETGFAVIVDLNNEDIEKLRKADVREGDILFAPLISVTNGLGLSAEWRFLATPFKKTSS